MPDGKLNFDVIGESLNNGVSGSAYNSLPSSPGSPAFVCNEPANFAVEVRYSW
jgi:hypothetical protein